MLSRNRVTAAGGEGWAVGGAYVRPAHLRLSAVTSVILLNTINTIKCKYSDEVDVHSLVRWSQRKRQSKFQFFFKILTFLMLFTCLHCSLFWVVEETLINADMTMTM